MQLSRLLFALVLLLAPVALLSTTWLYLYPVFDSACTFPTPPTDVVHDGIAPFRLLALGDPQLEGDSSLPKPGAPIFRSLSTLREDIGQAQSLLEVWELVSNVPRGVVKDLGRAVEGYVRKPVDIWGNDWYLAHVVRTVRWWAGPTHVSVLGDLIGSQWVGDREFERRAGRYWGRVFGGMEGWGLEEGYSSEGSSEDGSSEEGSSEEGSSNEGLVRDESSQEGDLNEPDPKGEDSRGESPNEGSSTGGSPRGESLHGDDSRGNDSRDENPRDGDRNVSAPRDGDLKSGDPKVDDFPSEEGLKEDDEERKKRKWGGIVEILGEEKSWANRVINIAGNHDIGYAGDIDKNRIARFERVFGQVNWDIVFELPTEEGQSENEDVPALRLVILNSMNLDTPAYDGDLQRETYEFINHIVSTSRPVTSKTHATILLTHIPLHKEPGVCVDSPFFDFFNMGGVKEQNMLSEHASKIILESIFGLSSNQHAEGQGFGRRGIILNGHDHAGCDVLHYTTQPGVPSACPENIDESEIHLPPEMLSRSADIPTESVLEDTFTSNETATEHEHHQDDQQPQEQEAKWQAQPFPHRPYKATPSGQCIALTSVPHIREVTLRSMMGDYQGYAYFLSAWFDRGAGEKGEWRMEISRCGLGVQHWWWGVHVLDLVVLVALVVAAVMRVVEGPGEDGEERVEGKGGK